MSSSYGKWVRISIFGQSHSEAIGVTIDGLPAGIRIDMAELQRFMNRRAPGQSRYSTPRKEADRPEFISGLVEDTSCGAPLTALIRNTNTKSKDYDNIRDIPRPGHADLTAHIKYRGFEDVRGGGHFSGRLTAPLCIAGGIFKQILQRKGIEIDARIVEIGGNSEDPYAEIDRAREDLDSVGGIVECRVTGLPAGIGDPMFDGVENTIAQTVFAIPAVKGIEFGAGFSAAGMRGSQNNDPFYMDEDGKIRTRSNNSGGILGGITNGMDIVFRCAFKPTPSIAKPQDSISWSTGKDAVLEIKGRHDPCIVPRALPCVESAAALALINLMNPADLI
ncbi:MAG: chorismate synthase [Eubacterium sp.]|jgi:chorismate synthase|nr:chorismate synthase [Eubacterium sp.]MCH4047313.1 chorismate synthase [Eubacterium sp.]MCH4080409.1 chorismate synthase [Eubacterium sp.]MCH4110657.1 chorismate synthase [Eubacterium sp.]MCI1307207.1 chorismate synthase [Eubacterium sp.]